MIPKVSFHGKAAREIDRMLGRVPEIDKAFQRRVPWVAREAGQVLVSKARPMAPVATGRLRSAIDYIVRPAGVAFGVWDVPYAYPLNFGVSAPMIVNSFDREQSVVFGRTLTRPIDVKVRQHVRRTKIKARPFITRAFYDSMRALYGIIGRAIDETKAEVGLE